MATTRSPRKTPKSPLALSLGSAVTLAAAGVVGTWALKTARAQPAPAASLVPPAPAAPAAPATQPATPADPAVPSVLSNKADVPAGPVQLAERPFETVAGGIALRYPAGSQAMREVGTDDLVELRNDALHWSLIVKRRTYPQPMNLVAARDGRGNVQPGIMELNAADVARQYGDPELLKKGQPGIKMLRQDLTNLGKYDVGMLAYRYTKDTVRYFAQRAIIEANDQVYYMVALTTPARSENVIPVNADGEEATEDPGERRAVETFRAVLESVRLLDRQKIRNEQVDRLYRTRTLMQNWTEKKLASFLLPEQYMRILKQDKGGAWKDVGWRYVVEEPERKGNREGMRVGIHTCYCEAGAVKPSPQAPRRESEAWLSVSLDRHHEDWSSQTVLDNGSQPTPKNPWPKLVEFGTSDLKASRFLLVNPRDPSHPENMYKLGSNDDPRQPWVGTRDAYTMSVQYVGTMGNQDPVSRALPVFYLPQALDSMLPRLLPPNEVKSYMMATYVSDAREVMMRYVEVQPIQVVTLAGHSFQAVPVTDHIGWEGGVTTHYITPTGQYLGSENKDTKTVVLPTDKQTLTRLWPDAELRSPGELGAAPSAAGPWGTSPGGPNPNAPSLNQPGPGRRGNITVGPDSPLDLERPMPEGAAPREQGVPDVLGPDTLEPARVLPSRGAPDRRAPRP